MTDCGHRQDCTVPQCKSVATKMLCSEHMDAFVIATFKNLLRLIEPTDEQLVKDEKKVAP